MSANESDMPALSPERAARGLSQLPGIQATYGISYLSSSPALFMLMVMFSRDSRMETATIHTISGHLDLPETLTRRWIDVLVQDGFVTPHVMAGNWSEKRFTLTGRGRELIHAYLGGLFEHRGQSD